MISHDIIEAHFCHSKAFAESFQSEAIMIGSTKLCYLWDKIVFICPHEAVAISNQSLDGTNDVGVIFYST